MKSIIAPAQKENSTIIISLLISDQSYHKQKQRRHDILLNDTYQNGIFLKMTLGRNAQCRIKFSKLTLRRMTLSEMKLIRMPAKCRTSESYLKNDTG
jgi:hypothetical protein